MNLQSRPTFWETRADKIATYTVEISNQLIDAKVDDVEMVNYAVKSDTYTKTEVNDKFTNIMADVPDALNALNELSDALGADVNISATV